MMQGYRAGPGVGVPLDPSTGPDGPQTAAPTSVRPIAEPASAHGTPGPADPPAILRELPQLDLAARRHLAERLAPRGDVPKAVAMALALDRIAVAYPVLRLSPVLDDADLMRIVEEGSHEHHLALTERASLSPAVTALLVEMSETDVMAQMLRNPAAMLTEYVFRRLVAASRHAEALRDPVIARRDLTPEMAQDLSRWVGPKQRRRIAERFGPETVLALADPSATLEEGSQRLPAAPAQSRPSPHVHPLVEAVRRNDRGKLERTLAAMSGLPAFAVLRILNDPDAESLAVLCRGLALKRRLFTALYALLHDGRARSSGLPAGAFRGAAAYFDRLQLPQAARILQGWRKAPITVWQSARPWSGRTWLRPDDQAA
jgi:uncharacterized protein (DUF2336 family)